VLDAHRDDADRVALVRQDGGRRISGPSTEAALESEPDSAGASRIPVEHTTRAASTPSSARPAITGRIVEREARREVPHAAGTFTMRASGSTTGLVCDELGRFCIPLACLPVRSVGLTLSSPGLGRVVVDLAHVPDGGTDLGDLELEPANDVHFVAMDAAGAPLCGAVARVDGPALVRSDPTRADGRGVLRAVLASAHAMEVEALGYETAEVRLGDEGSLESLPLVSAKRAGAASSRCSGATARRSPTRSCCCPAWTASRSHPIVGRAPMRSSSTSAAPRRRTLARSCARETDPRIELVYAPDPNGKLCLPGLHPSCALEVAVEDKLGNVLMSQRVDPEELARNEETVLRVDRAPAQFVVHVTDASGAPLAGAEISRFDAREILGTTDASGIATLGPSYGDALRVVVARSGFAPQRVDVEATPRPVPPAGVDATSRPVTRAEVVLRPGRTVRVRVVDARGADASFDALSARFENHVVGVQSLIAAAGTSSSREFRDLPQGPFEWVVAAGARRIREPCAADRDDVVIRLPPP
jgi:hypothetical protein